MTHWTSDQELFDLARRQLFAAVVGDVMDKLGFRRQFLPPQVKPLRHDMVVVGRAMPVLEPDVYGESLDGANQLLSQPFGLMFKALDDLRPGEVYICTGASPTYALWGELMSTRAIQLGAAGAVLNGFSRDTKGILALNFPTFSYGGYAQDQGPRGKVIDFRIPIEIGGVRITPGDIVFGDLDGVCIVPRAGTEEVFNHALEKVSAESQLRKSLLEGVSASEAFAQYGIM